MSAVGLLRECARLWRSDSRLDTYLAAAILAGLAAVTVTRRHRQRSPGEVAGREGERR